MKKVESGSILLILLLASSCAGRNVDSHKPKRERQLMSEDEMTDFKKKYGVNQSCNLPMQSISAKTKKKKLKANGKTYDVSDLKPFSIMSANATITVDGKQRKAGNTLFRGNVGGANILLRRNKNGHVEYANIEEKNGKRTSLVNVLSGRKDTLVSIREEDYDMESLRKFGLKDEKFHGGNAASNKPKQAKDASTADGELWEASVGGACGVMKQIDIAVSFDHTFCNRENGERNAVKKVQTIVALVSDIYAPLCLKVKISHIDGYCSSSSDPYNQMDTTRSGCGCNGCGLLSAFRDKWNNQHRSIKRDVAHVFMGQRFSRDGNTIGCAYIEALCGSYGYGVNDMSFSNLDAQQAMLLAHELGHNAGSNHASAEDYVMSGTIGDGSRGWASGSQRDIAQHVKESSCIATVRGGDDGDDGDGDDGNDPVGAVEFRRGGKKCLTASSTSDGTTLTVARCNGSNGQRWTMESSIGSSGRIKSNADSRKCVDVDSLKNNKPLKLRTCSSAQTQKWKFSNDGTFQSGVKKRFLLCIDDSIVELGKCKTSTNPKKQWRAVQV